MTYPSRNRSQLLGLMAAVAAVLIGATLVQSPAVLIGGVVAVVAIFAPPRWKVALLVITAQLPFAVGTVRGIANVLVIELVAVPLLALAMLDALRSRRPIVPPSGRVVAMIVLVFAVLAFAHAFGIAPGVGSIGNELAGPNLRAYFDLMIGIVTIFAAMYWSSAEESWTDGPLLLVTIVGLTAGAVRLLAYFAGFEMPLLAGRFQYDVVTSVGGVAVARIGGLTEAASLVVGGALGLIHRRRLVGLASVSLLCGIGLAVISGGRSYAIGLFVGAVVYFTTLRGTRSWLRTVAIASAALLASVSVAFVGLGSQLTRLSAFAGGLQGQDPYRYAAMSFMWIEFLRSPVFGKGIGAPGLGLSNEFVAEQVRQGGHTTYLSSMANFGVVGLAYVVGVLGTALVRAWRALRFGRVSAGMPVSGLMVFALFVLATRVLEYAVAGNGYADFGMYAIAGMVMGLRLGVQEAAPDA